MKFAILTGNIGSGKSTVAAELRKLGYPVIDSDRLMKDIYLTDPGVRGAIFSLFGPDALDPINGLSAKVRRLALEDMTVYRWLEHIIERPMDDALESIFWKLPCTRGFNVDGHTKDIAFIETAVMSDWIFGGTAMTRARDHEYTFKIWTQKTEDRIDRVVERYRKKNRLQTEPYGFELYPKEVYENNKKLLDAYRDMAVRTDRLQDIVNNTWHDENGGHPDPMEMLNESEDQPARIASEIDLIVSK
jgi:adenylate kinase family enzyme